MEDERRTGMRQLGWLIERMNAQKRPITGEQTEKFGRHPQGPILPGLCLEAKRLPDECRRAIPSANPICGLSVSPKGEPCYATVIDKKVTIVCDKECFVLDSKDEEETDPWGYESICESVEILGFPLEDAPYSLVRMRYFEPANHFPHYSSRLYRKEKLVHVDVHSATLLSNGALICANKHRDKIGAVDGYDVYKNDKIILKRTKKYLSRFFEAPDGRIMSVWSEGRRKVAGYLVEEKPFDLSSSISIEDIVLTERGVQFIWGKECALLALNMHVTAYFGSNQNPNPYRSNYTELPDERVAYIGETTRDHFECWIVDREEQPGFQLVSPLFERHGQWCYYGVIGRHLYTMAIPNKQS
ncbi:hypothetical protein KJ969_04485 [Patescibacteria group bacterium]|nr:hypothetical protein [Patescibacteria group bacterium]MBU1921894.1 hypothetical protein [Patescibacteria group bacterium]